MESPNRVLIAADLEAGGIWLISMRSEESRRGWGDRLGHRLAMDLKAWNDSADGLFGGRVRPEGCGRNAVAAHYSEARALASRVQKKLGPGWEVLWNEGANGCWSWVERPSAWTG